MTGGQTTLSLESEDLTHQGLQDTGRRDIQAQGLAVWQVSAEDLQQHQDYLDLLQQKAGKAVW